MDSNFSYFSFSIFKGCTFEEFTDAVLNHDFFKALLDKDKASFIPQDKLDLRKYIDPETGATLEHFSWWASESYPNMVFLSSNQADGFYSGCYSLRSRLGCSYVNFTVSQEGDLESYNKNSFYYMGPDKKERVVYSLKEDRWTFYQEGDPLPFEDLSHYGKRRVKDRINFDIIKEYLLKIGIDFYKIDSQVTKCSSFIRAEWGD